MNPPEGQDALGAVSFRPLDDDDLPMLHEWLNDPGVVRWWEGDDVSWDGVVASYGSAARARGVEEHYIPMLDGEPVGWIQCYPAFTYPEEAEPWAAHGISRSAAGIDYLVGRPADRGHGLGSAVIEAFVHEIVFAGHPGFDQACASPFLANEASWKALARAGFDHVADYDDDDGRCRLMSIDRPT